MIRFLYPLGDLLGSMVILIAGRCPNSCLKAYYTCRGMYLRWGWACEGNSMGIIPWRLLCGDLWTTWMLSQLLESRVHAYSYFSCIYLLIIIIFIYICSFNLVIGHFCEQNRQSKTDFWNVIYIDSLPINRKFYTKRHKS